MRMRALSRYIRHWFFFSSSFNIRRDATGFFNIEALKGCDMELGLDDDFTRHDIYSADESFCLFSLLFFTITIFSLYIF